MSASYTKLKDGSWGVRVQGAALKGQTITVTKKDGGTKTETIRAVLWSGNGVTLCAIEQRERSGNGYAPGKRCYCAECGEPYRKGQHCWENGGTCTPQWE